MIDYKRKIDAFRDVRSCEDYIKLARHNNHDNAVSYAERKESIHTYRQLSCY